MPSARKVGSLLGPATLTALGLAVALPQAAHAQLTRYATRAQFSTVFSGLPLETFEAANIGNSGIATFPSPLDSTINNTVFTTGSIQDGLRVADLGPGSGSPQALAAAQAGVFGNPTKAVYSESAGDGLFISFYNGNGVQATGLDLLSFGFTTAPATETVTVFSGTTVLGTFTPTVSPTGTFFGVSSGGALITGLSITGDINHARGVDNIAFTTPEPSSAAAFAFIGLGMLGLMFRARKRESVIA